MRRGLSGSRGNYRTLLRLFGMESRDYKRFMNFLATHDCRVDFREFRSLSAEQPRSRRPLLPPLPAIESREPRISDDNTQSDATASSDVSSHKIAS